MKICFWPYIVEIGRYIFHKIGPAEVVISSAKFDIKNSIDRNSCRSRQDESNRHNNMGFRNYCWSDGMPTRSCAPPRSKNWTQKLGLDTVCSPELALSMTDNCASASCTNRKLLKNGHPPFKLKWILVELSPYETPTRHVPEDVTKSRRFHGYVPSFFRPDMFSTLVLSIAPKKMPKKNFSGRVVFFSWIHSINIKVFFYLLVNFDDCFL
jgi:hypothetical protein